MDALPKGFVKKTESSLPKGFVKKTEQVKKETDFMNEKQLLVKIVSLLENIRDDSKVMNAHLERIGNHIQDTSNEVKYSREDTKKHRDNNTESW